MECRCPTVFVHKKQKTSVRAPCNQCVNCRINRRDWLVTRMLLEHQSNIFGQFWTLTLSDSGLVTLEEKGGKHLIKVFLQSMRARERRRGNLIPVRCFGVLEYGTTLGRPHFHLLLWNHLHLPLLEETYIEGLPRIRHNIGPWPHGHVDCCPLTPSSCRYVAKYVTKFNDLESGIEKPLNFHPRQPALGSIGLRKYVQRISTGPTRKWTHSPTIEIDGYQWHLDHRRRAEWWYYAREFGLPTIYDNGGMESYRLEQLARREETTWTQGYAQRKADLTRELMYEHGKRIRDAKTASMLSRALHYASRNAHSPSATNQIVTTDALPVMT